MINLNGTTTGYGANTAELANADIRIGNGAAPTNGIYSPAANQLALSTAGTGRLFVDASGKVGIGTSSPGFPFQVKSTTNAHVAIWDNGGIPQVVGVNDAGGSSQLRLAGQILSFTGNGGAGSEHMRLDASGQLGIGTSNPQSLASIGLGSSVNNGLSLTWTGDNIAKAKFFVNTATGEVSIGGSYGGYFPVFLSNSSEAARIDLAGRLLLGTSNSRQFNQSIAALQLQIEGTTYQSSSMSLVANQNGGDCSYIVLGKSRGTTLNSSAIVSSGDRLGAFWFCGADGTDLKRGAVIEALVDGTPGANDMPGRLVFSVTADGAASPTERMVIKSDGKVGIGTSSPNQLLHVNQTGVVGGEYGIRISQTSATANALKVLIDSANTTSSIMQESTVPLILGTNNTERLRITSDGKVGIGTGSPGSPLTIESSAGNQVKITYPSIVSYFLNATSGGDFAINKDGTERLRIDSTGRLLVGTSSALTGAASQFSKGVFIGNSSNNGAGYTAFGRGSSAIGAVSGTDIALITFTDNGAAEFASISCYVDGTVSADDYPGRLVFYTTADGAATPTEAMRINNQRELLIGTTTRTANGGVLQVSNGITFPGTQSACSDPNTLDDYEEGTWTPTVIGASTAGTATYATQNARYTKTGRVVFIEFYLVWSGGTGTGNLLVSGLPFTSANSATYPSLSIGSADLLALTAGNYPGAYVTNNATTITFVQHPTGGGGRTPIPYDAQAELIISGTYTVA